MLWGSAADNHCGYLSLGGIGCGYRAKDHSGVALSGLACLPSLLATFCSPLWSRAVQSTTPLLKTCRRTFNEPTATLMAKTRLSVKIGRLHQVPEQYPELPQDWKENGNQPQDRFLLATQKIRPAPQSRPRPKIDGAVEVDEKAFRRSQKGKRGLVRPRKRGGRTMNGQARGMAADKCS